jgi:hypothetical protein
MDPFPAQFVVTWDATPDGIRVVRSVHRAISSLAIKRETVTQVSEIKRADSAAGLNPEA